MEHMDKETFDFKFGQELVYTTPLSDGRLVELIPGGSGVVVRYEDRMEFIRLVQKSRLEESREQVILHQSILCYTKKKKKKKKKSILILYVFICLTQKSDDRVNTEKYRNSNLHIKKTCAGIDQSSEFAVSDWFWKNGIFASILKTLLTKKFALQELLIQQRTDLAVLPALIELLGPLLGQGFLFLRGLDWQIKW